jgi:hypothetical protein
MVRNAMPTQAPKAAGFRIAATRRPAEISTAVLIIIPTSGHLLESKASALVLSRQG